METTSDQHVAYSHYSALLINYIRSEHLDDGLLGDVDYVDFIRGIGQARSLENIPEELKKFYTKDFQDEVKAWAVANGQDPDYFPTLDAAESTGSDA